MIPRFLTALRAPPPIPLVGAHSTGGRFLGLGELAVPPVWLTSSATKSARQLSTRLGPGCVGVLLSMVVALTLSGCSDDTNPPRKQDLGNLFPDASPNPCAGCQGCCQNTQCLPGTSISACGYGGLTCRTCNATDQCLNGTCVSQQPSCSASTCRTGCCNSQGTCVTAVDETNCGTAGSSCIQCTSGEVCTATGTCETAAPKSYSVTINSCEITKKCDNIWTQCEAYAEVALGGGAVVKTPIVKDTLAPVWDFKLFDATDKELTSNKLMVTIYDKDFDWDDKMGVCEISVTAAALTAHTLTTACGPDVKNLRFSFTPK